jgi:DNA-binding NtrC family response regulator
MVTNKKILVIEDDESSRETLVSYLEEAGYIVISTNNGIKGLELMKNYNPDLVISDNRLPYLNGIELACINESFKNKIPFIIMSGYDDIQEYIKDLNVIAFIQKPVDIKLLDYYINQAWVN